MAREPSRTFGYAALITIAAFAFVFMHSQRGAAIPDSRVPTPPVQLTGVDSSRFDADAWYLPHGELRGFVEIEEGPFTMGSDPARDPLAYENERWSAARFQGSVQLPGYYLARYEVTVAQFHEFAAAAGRAEASQSASAQAGTPNRPIVNITWADAALYALWLEEEVRKSPNKAPAVAALLEEGWTLRLPSEAEWEKGARGGDGRIFPWGDVADSSQAVFASTGAADVGSAPCNACVHGLSDMSGNVWEMTRSPYEPYPFSFAPTSPSLPGHDALFVMRGGGYSDQPGNIRSAVRGGVDPGARKPFIGFRLALVRP